MTDEHRKLLQEALEAHEAANAALGVDDPLPWDMKAKAFYDAYLVTGGEPFDNWAGIREALK